jgi:putative aldouronate transport system permease protein
MYGLVIAFQDYQIGNSFLSGPWVGLAHFHTFFENPDFTRVITNTLLISLYRLIFIFFPPIILAILLNEVLKNWFKRWVQTLTYLPHFLSWVIIYGITFSFLSEGTGLVNQWIKDMGFSTVDFMQSEHWFRSIIVMTDVWKDTGWSTIIYMASIAAINPELYEAAKIDGSSKWRQIWHVTIPGIAPVIILLLIIRLGHIMDAGLEQILVFYNPLVYSVGDIIDTWTYRMGILEGRYSLAAAVGVFKSAVGLLLIMGANWLARRWNDSGIW